MSSAPTADDIARDASWLAQALDPAEGVVRLVAMDSRSYRLASFLDDRLLQSPVDAQRVAWTTIEEAITDDLRSDARWIFHIGHVGSTLVSRLLGEIDGVLAIREPRLLRDVALSPSTIRERYVRPVPRLMSRTFGPAETACVKATSFASEIAADLVTPGERALFLFASPRNYIASILAGENSLRELHALADYRAKRMNGRVHGLEGEKRSDAHRAAAAWACEMTSLESASEAMPSCKIAWADFDAMLAEMPNAIAGTAAHFGFSSDPGTIETIVGGPLMQRYSKAPEYQYSASLRRELISDAQAHFAPDIESALAMLERAAEDSPLLVRALSRAKES